MKKQSNLKTEKKQKDNKSLKKTVDLGARKDKLLDKNAAQAHTPLKVNIFKKIKLPLTSVYRIPLQYQKQNFQKTPRITNVRSFGGHR